MSGHSKWATTKRQKAEVDAKKGAIFTKIANMITIAAREKGGDPETNFNLRMAIEKGRSVNMPKENVERAIKRGLGELAGVAPEELIYEGFGPVKTHFIVKVLTDNKNRSAAEIRHLFAEYGGSLGAVRWNFSEQGVIRVAAEDLPDAPDKESFELSLIDAGAEDIKREEEGLTVYCQNQALPLVKKIFDRQNIPTESAAVEYVAKEKAALAPENRENLEKFLSALDECEEIVDYYHNADI